MIEFDVPAAAAAAIVNEGCAVPALDDHERRGRLVVVDRETRRVVVPAADAEFAVRLLQRTSARLGESNRILLKRGATDLTIEVDPNDQWGWLRVSGFFSAL